ncbi:hypothetical protein B0H13DRAFT_1896625 [Mycena leptocephala]|nr:hypothetical protein B0H13DRAFT_1896625 [Mycena leptocephala]
MDLHISQAGLVPSVLVLQYGISKTTIPSAMTSKWQDGAPVAVLSFCSVTWARSLGDSVDMVIHRQLRPRLDIQGIQLLNLNYSEKRAGTKPGDLAEYQPGHSATVYADAPNLIMLRSRADGGGCTPPGTQRTAGHSHPTQREPTPENRAPRRRRPRIDKDENHDGKGGLWAGYYGQLRPAVSAVAPNCGLLTCKIVFGQRNGEEASGVAGSWHWRDIRRKRLRRALGIELDDHRGCGKPACVVGRKLEDFGGSQKLLHERVWIGDRIGHKSGILLGMEVKLGASRGTKAWEISAGKAASRGVERVSLVVTYN